MSFLDPDWAKLLADADVDDAFHEWQERQDRITEFGGAGAFEKARNGLAPGSHMKGEASGLPASGLSRTTENLSPAPRTGASPSADGLLLLPARPRTSPRKDAA